VRTLYYSIILLLAIGTTVASTGSHIGVQWSHNMYLVGVAIALLSMYSLYHNLLSGTFSL
jgi:hypothetical protein